MCAHYYDIEGNLHECDVRKARKLGLFPSVNTIGRSVIQSPGLERWKQRKCVELALKKAANPFNEPIPADAIINEALSETSAADLGTAMHSFYAEYCRGVRITAEEEPYHTMQEKFVEWAEYANIRAEWVEFPLVNREMRFAGRPDFYGYMCDKRTLIDWKTHAFKEDQTKLEIYEAWLFEVAGYMHLIQPGNAEGHTEMPMVHFVVQSTSPHNLGEIFVEEVDEETLVRWMDVVFWHGLEMWKGLKKF